MTSQELKEIIKKKNVKLDRIKITNYFAIPNVINVLGDNLTVEEAYALYDALRKGELELL